MTRIENKGTKDNMLNTLSSITHIDEAILRDSSLLPTVSLARRMSWAAKRHTTREEDQAYCLFGIFNIHLPLIYGEVMHALMRLQEAIAQTTMISVFLLGQRTTVDIPHNSTTAFWLNVQSDSKTVTRSRDPYHQLGKHGNMRSRTRGCDSPRACTRAKSEE